MISPCILICEDETALREDLAAELAEAGYVVLSAADGRDALNLLGEHRPDLILCDIGMPRLNGRELLERLRTDRPDLADVPFLFLTALSDRAEIIAGKLAGADDYLVKPVDYDLMLVTIAAHLRQVTRFRAAEVARHVDAPPRLEALASTSARALLDKLAAGIVILGPTGEVLQANAAAQALCTPEANLALGSQLVCLAPGINLRTMIDLILRDGAARFAPVTVPRTDGLRDLILLLGPLAEDQQDLARMIVVIVDPSQRNVAEPRLLERAFGLTPTEARIACLLAQGLRPEDIARDMGVTGTTVAFHLKNLFSKTQTNRQSDLIALILSLPVLLPL